MVMDIQSLSDKVYSNLKSESDRENVFIDPATAALIGSVVIELIKAIVECRKAKKMKEQEVLEVAHNPNERQKRAIRRTLRRKLGRKRYLQEGFQYENSIIKSTQTITQEELESIFKDYDKQDIS
jgi:hypothetical protein